MNKIDKFLEKLLNEEIKRGENTNHHIKKEKVDITNSFTHIKKKVKEHYE